MKICPKCDTDNVEENKYCTNCASPLEDGKKKASGKLTPTLSEVSEKNEVEEKNPAGGEKQKEPILTAVASFIIPGAGQIWLGQLTKGVGILVLAILLSCFTGGLAYIIAGIFSAVDAFKLTEKINTGKQLEDMEFFFQNK